MSGGWDHRLALVGSEARAAVLVDALRATRGKRRSDLLSEWFNCCDALAPQRHVLRTYFAAAGWLTDSPDDVPDFPVTVYRGAWEDDDVETALSWTTSREVAERFARGLTSPRAMFLGIWRDDAEPYIWQATCESAFAYFNSRAEQEVVADVLSDIVPVAVLRKVAAA